MLSYDKIPCAYISYGMLSCDISSYRALSPVLTPAPVARDQTAYQRPANLSAVQIEYLRLKEREGNNGASMVFKVRKRNHDIM